ncbi:hypothetical protein PAXINDRAFT_11170 [Paxillus involutus ATCC 200175]|nr:hypothetical protein PAXINDRAFT_11170 [Paxillus involutus ATCC 200175]
METKLTAYTANDVATIEGKGTIIIRYKDEQGYAIVARLHPILYMPQLNHQLLSMGSFLRDKLTVHEFLEIHLRPGVTLLDRETQNKYKSR